MLKKKTLNNYTIQSSTVNILNGTKHVLADSEDLIRLLIAGAVRSGYSLIAILSASLRRMCALLNQNVPCLGCPDFQNLYGISNDAALSDTKVSCF